MRRYVLLDLDERLSIRINRNDSVILNAGRYQLDREQGVETLEVDERISVQQSPIGLGFLTSLDGLPVKITEEINVRGSNEVYEGYETANLPIGIYEGMCAELNDWTAAIGYPKVKIIKLETIGIVINYKLDGTGYNMTNIGLTNKYFWGIRK